ncbi:hypothetical protein G5V57_04600 [Nordella sp. HKS 07]|uniref:hypothetical protein n=1 Tax=Nordella sp. HKS 07 TaxID=2712222 RepID=UPI0013E1B90D|nr:hypothetical protein [Nordella sp. HKS 07]QIG47087.1 hypothetical protein G5V57_04600 [Nordella sp. HKS 07]
MATVTREVPLMDEASKPAVVWGPIFAGAFAAVAATAVLVLLGSGLGLTLISPWSGESAGLATVAASTAIWLVVVQWLSSALGGYLSGRLRTKWVGVHSDEVFFRDTAHGFMAWAMATLLIIGLVGIHTTMLLGAGTHVAASVAGGAANAASQTAQANNQNEATGYLVDSLLRPADPARLTTTGAEADQAASAQASRILVMGALQGEVTQEDRTYLASLVAARTGLAQQDAQARVEAILTKANGFKAKAQQAADDARKASATAAILGALSMVIGAFIASVAGAMGGRQRDDDELKRDDDELSLVSSARYT